MKTFLILTILLTLLSSCGTLSRQDRIFKCMERLEPMGADVTSSYAVCKDLLTNKPERKEDRERDNK